MILTEYTKKEKEKEAEISQKYGENRYVSKEVQTAEYLQFIHEVEQRQNKYFSKNINVLTERIKIIVPRIIIILHTITKNGNDINILSSMNLQGITILGYTFTFSAYKDSSKLKSEIVKALNSQFELLRKKAPEEYNNILRFIDETIKNKDKIIKDWDKAFSDNHKESALSLSFMFNGKAISALGQAKTIGKKDPLSDTLDVNGVAVFSPESAFKIGVGTAKIFRYAVAEFTKNNSQNAPKEKIRYSIFLDVKDFATANGVDINSDSAMKNFRFKLRKNLETLRSSGVSWTEKIKEKFKSFGGMNYIGKYELRGNTLEIEFTVTMAEYLTRLPLIQYPRALYKLDDQDYNAFAIGEAMCVHYSQDNNVIKGTEGKLKVETLLKYTSFPSWDELKEKEMGWEQKVKAPFERALDKLTQCGFLKDWEYCYEGGIEIPDEEMRKGNVIKNYKDFISLIVKFELNDFEDRATRAIEIAKKKAEQIQKFKNKPKKTTKQDEN